ncbi:MAG: hypothetical protein AB8B89_05420 [Gammaproteobacteria bacterium]
MPNTKSQTNTPDKNTSTKYKDIEEAIQKAIDSKSSHINDRDKKNCAK